MSSLILALFASYALFQYSELQANFCSIDYFVWLKNTEFDTENNVIYNQEKNHTGIHTGGINIYIKKSIKMGCASLEKVDC